jgi:Tol biopolymer transport system component/DNA-binding winged helix-turn-helix (wHTH) protein
MKLAGELTEEIARARMALPHGHVLMGVAMAEVPAPARRPLRFSSFELDLQSGELRKAGVLVGLQEQSLKVLVELLARPGDLVTREQLHQRLWPDGTFVDVDHGLNAVINRLRETLGDSADSPRFIQTVPRRGYRFIASVEGGAETVAGEPVARASVADDLPVSQSHPLRKRIGRSTAIAVAGLILMVAMVAAIGLLRRTPMIDGPPTRIVPLTRLAGKESWPAFAPDGEQVAFAWSGEKFDNTDIYVTLVGSTSVRRVTTDPADDFAPSWSRDGRRIAFLRKTGHSARIHVTSALGGPDSQLSEFPVGVTEIMELIGAQITWSPDGRYILAGRDPRFATGVSAGLYRIPVEGGEPHPITRPKRPTFDMAPAFSADGHRLAYLSCDSIGMFLPLLVPELCAVHVIDVDDRSTPTTEARTLAQPQNPAGVAWSRDGKSIVFAGGASGPVRLWRLWVDRTRPPERVEIAGEWAENPATAASRDRLVFSHIEWDSHLYRFNAGLPAEQVAASSSFETDPHFSPDGRRLAFASGRSGYVAIWVAAADGSDARQLTHDTRQWPGSPAWSPDGRSIAFDGGDVGGQVHIWTIDAEGGTPRQITTGPGSQTVPRWSRDGQWIYFSRHQDGARDIWRVRATGGQPEQVTRTGSSFLGYELEDGTSLLYQPVNGDSALLLLALTGATAPRQLVNCARLAAFAPTGRRVVYVACDPSSRPPVRVIDLDTGRDRLLGRLEHFPPGSMHVNLAASPDGGTILFRGDVRRGGDLMLIENFR